VVAEEEDVDGADAVLTISADNGRDRD